VHTFRLTDDDRTLIAEALVGFRQDFVYLQRILWAARKARESAERVAARTAESAAADPPPPPVPGP